ncbi:MAG: hypothetical protein MZV49_07425 [Rhodopseudomonas palustris]|nr:hypothetical protein [Rhodopseudomonas palustris]
MKTALENYRSGKSTEADLLKTAAPCCAPPTGRARKAMGIAVIPSNDFTFYDHALDTSIMVGRNSWTFMGGTVRGGVARHHRRWRARLSGKRRAEPCATGQHASATAQGVPAWEMTKWFDTNYHYIVPETGRRPVASQLDVARRSLAECLEEARAARRTTSRPVLPGPVTFLTALSRHGPGVPGARSPPSTCSTTLLPVYLEGLRRPAWPPGRVAWVRLGGRPGAGPRSRRTPRARNVPRLRYAPVCPRAGSSTITLIATYFGDPPRTISIPRCSRNR